MKLTFFAMDGATVDLRRNPATRAWMDATSEGYAYRCLPLNIANSHGWSFHLPFPILVHWSGGPGLDALRVMAPDGADHSQVASSHFGHGIVTFFIHGLFRTEPGWNLRIGGAPNRPIDGLYPLEGVVETDWSPYSFTMNWQVTRPGTWLMFPEGFPFCSVFPVERALPERVEPEMRDLSAAPELADEHARWSASRSAFTDALRHRPESDAVRQKWQKSYYQGREADGEPGAADHRIKLRTRDFRDLRAGRS